MPKLSTAVTTTATTAVQIKPTVKKKLLTALKGWAEQHLKEKAAAEEKTKYVKEVLEIQVDLEESQIEVEGFKSTVVAPKGRKTLNRKKFVKLGGNLEILDAAYEEGEPGNAYPKITPPGAKEHSDE